MIEYFGTNPIVAVYCGHTPCGANQYFEQPHEHSSLCKLISTTSKRIAGLDPGSRESATSTGEDDELVDVDHLFSAAECNLSSASSAKCNLSSGSSGDCNPSAREERKVQAVLKQITTQDEGASIVKRKRVESEGNPERRVKQKEVHMLPMTPVAFGSAESLVDMEAPGGGNMNGIVMQWNVWKKVKVSRTDTKIDLSCYIFILNSLSLMKPTKYIIFHTMSLLSH